ncbi:calcium-binding protein [Rhizobium sp. ARZ01]|uniref:calcium-binding protein n=1 Tax=Rhizobium sp. ARZ01 TaxID=2769313 RepID=UPI0017810769|nr:calcium-binding protein [Rhizobium sp. ARZ01]MBD9374145.1 calcium-binding protein [Rhizobium sp. ARZ01]
MATYTVFFPNGKYPQSYSPAIPGFDYNPMFGELVDPSTATVVTKTPTKVDMKLDNGLKLRFSGTDFTYGSDGSPTGGKVTKIELFQSNGTTLVSKIEGLSLSLEALDNAAQSFDPWNLQAWILKGSDKLNGSAGNDDLEGFAGNDVINANGGDDFVIGGEGKDTYDGGTGWDNLSFQDARHNSNARGGISLDAATGKVTDPYGNVETFQNFETFRGTQFRDVMKGSARDEDFQGIGGRDIIDGRGGFDTVSYHRDQNNDGGKVGVTVNLQAGTAVDGFGKTDTLTSIEGVRGTAFADKLTGSSGDNWLRGDGGNDMIAGGLGNDLLRGDSGKDSFVFNTKLSASTNVDEIDDFNVVYDTIRLENAIFTKLTGTGVLTAAQFCANNTGTAADASDRIIYEKDAGNLYYDWNGSASGGRVLFAVLDAGLKMTADDFFTF